jgi:integrase
MIDDKKDLIIISGKTSGIKRTEDNEHIPHKIPITPLMWQIIEKCKKLSRGERYLFLSNGLGKKVHADPEAPNRYFKNLGYKNKQTAHGWRRVFLTYGIDLLKEREVIIRRQMGHLPTGSVLKAYDGSELLEERYNFLVNWGNHLVKNGLEV